MNSTLRQQKRIPFYIVMALLICLSPLLGLATPGVARADDTGFMSPTANAAVTSGAGDNDGFEVTPANAYADGGGNAASMDCDCSGCSGDDSHLYYNFGLGVPAGSIINGIEVRLDWWLDSASGNNTLDAELSWDGGLNWTALKSTPTEPTSETTHILGGSGDTWGHSWSASQLNDANFRLRLTCETDVDNARDYFLDYVAVRVTYDPPNCTNVQTQLALIVDGSTSISSTDFNTMKNGIGDAIEGGVASLQMSPTSNAADTGGDGNGFEVNPTNAYANGSGNASNIDGAGDRHRYYNYNFNIPAGATIDGIVTRLDWWLDSTSGTNSMSAELSWDGGTSWTAAKTDTTESTSEHTANLGGSADTWGHPWTISELNNTNFRVRLTCNSTSDTRDFFLDWVPVTVYYSLPCVPHDGTLQLTVIQIGLVGSTGAAVEVGPVTLTASNYHTVATAIRAIVKRNGFTPIACALYLAADTLHDSPCFNPNIKQAINLVTDGIPNRCCPPAVGGSNYTADDCGGCPEAGCTAARNSALTARNYAISHLGMTSNQDEIDAEFIGTQGAGSEWLRTDIVWPEQPDGNGYYAPPFNGPGWVRVISSGQDYADSICEKFAQILTNITATKTDSLFTDLNSNGIANPGDVLLYTIVIHNAGITAADNVTYHDVITDTNIILTDNVTTTQGTITLGNAGGNEVQIAIGSIPVGGSVTITFRVTIINPLPVGVTQVSNHGEIVGNNFPSKPTDDPDTGAADDPTVTPVTAAPLIEAFKDFSLDVDADHNGVPSPGDTIKYTITIENNGNQDAGNVTFSDTPDANTTLIVGSVTTSQGTITSGNSVGNTSVGVNLGTIPGNHHHATITFKVIVTSPLPSGVTEVCNQGIVSSSNFHIEPTDDPNTQIDDDPTCIQLTAAPHIIATKHAALIDDFGSDGPGPSDNLSYTITILNNGNQNAAGVTFSDTPDANTTLVVGSVVTSGGTVTTGNNTGDTSVFVNVGTISGGGGTVTISFKVTIKDPFPQGVDEVCNQGNVFGTNFETEPTDDPDTTPTHDPTCLTVTASPSIHVSKTDVLFTDTDHNGVPSPGDILEYIITILNNGNTAATGVTYSDTPDVNTSLVVGSVTTSQGSVTLGNGGGDTTVGVNVGAIAVSVTVNISFKVTINNPFPLGETQVCNQGTVSGSNFSVVLTDNPDTEALNDPTCTPVTAAPSIYASKTDSLSADNDHNLIPSPGDVLKYTIVITNTGNTAADNVTYHDVINDPNLTLSDNVTTTQGTITLGNAGGNEAEVAIGNIPAGGSVTITFLVTIINPLPVGVTQVQNHGEIVGNNFVDVPTDDPDTGALQDPTITPVTAAPLIDVIKVFSLDVDADQNGIPSPGDTIKYTVTIENNGNQDASGVTYSDTPDINTALIVGSVTTSQGTVTSGNSGGDTSVVVSVGTIPGNHHHATITYKVTIDSPLPAETNEVCNQGIVSGSNFDSQLSDVCDICTSTNPTCVPLNAEPHIRATKHVALTDDVPPAGPSPSDLLTYTITIINTGNQNAAGIVFTDTPDANTTLIVGSVTTSSGAVISGNTAGDTSVEVDIATIPGGGGTVIISFQVTVNSQLPPGITDVCNQGAITALNVQGTVVTNDPDTEAFSDTTCTTVTANPSIHATKRWVLLIDADSNGIPSTGDTLTYFITILNNGNTVASNVMYSDTPDANSLLVVGSVTTSQGTVTSGNNAGDTTVGVSVGNIAPGVSVDIAFDVTINCGGFNQIQNQGQVVGNNFSQTATDDPTTEIIGDPTISPTVASACPTETTIPVTPTPRPSPSMPGLAGANTPAQFCVKYTRCKPRINPGQPLVVSTNVVNQGDQAGTYNVVLKINGKVEQQKVVTVGPRLASPVNFTVVKSEPGTYNVTIDNEQTSFTVVSQETTRQYAGPIIAIVGIIFMLLFVMVLILIRRRLEVS